MEKHRKFSSDQWGRIASSASKLLFPPVPVVPKEDSLGSTRKVEESTLSVVPEVDEAKIDTCYQEYIGTVRHILASEFPEQTLDELGEYDLLSTINGAAATTLFQQSFSIFPELVNSTKDGFLRVHMPDQHRKMALDVMRAWMLGAAYNRRLGESEQKVSLLHNRTDGSHFFKAFKGAHMSVAELYGDEEFTESEEGLALIRLTTSLTPADPEYVQMLRALVGSVKTYLEPPSR